ncbi:helix-turn-helix domain-containing protein [Streptomyces sp. ICBB 8177]|uniref:PucR family transcriptional regulator n=1 Tax=Streptomyces sp. ICBB 8177 TaxID=563922 RepID=UPI000D682139|nr:helix-turn-helix domain-containing protein [Streptomyces sp. ICBB 8177]PWI45162.1 hypothetical protein CK485_03110 [Streptomyces sp. ICBB 8177]
MTTVPPQDGVAFTYELSAAARALAARCEPRVNEIARRMSRVSFEAIPGYPELPADIKDIEVAATARHGLRLFLRRVHDQHGRFGDYGLFRERAAQRAEEGVPLHLLLRAHALGAYMLWRTLREAARPGEETALVELSGFLLRAQEGIASAVAETYLDEQAALLAERREHRRLLVRGLLDGSPLPDAATQRALGLDRGALVLCLRTPRAAPAPGSASPAPVAVRRRGRRVQTALDRAFRTDVLALLDDEGGYAVVPAPPGADAPPEAPDGLAESLGKACGGEVRIAAVTAGCGAEVAKAARTAAEVIRVARAGGRPPGLHRLDDVLLEFHLSRRDESSGLIAALLDPIADRPELTETLRTYLEHQQDRRATARRLGLHPNTVDNRLARVTALTSLDLASPRGTALALAALLLRGEA